jgi:hypothetical protein
MEAKSSLNQPSRLISVTDRGTETSLEIDTPLPPLAFPWSVVSSISILGAIAFSICACISKERQQVYTVKPGDKIICPGCEYFNSNLYLKCAIHPSTVLTEQAIDCADYCPNRKMRQAKERSKSLPFLSYIFPNRS